MHHLGTGKRLVLRALMAARLWPHVHFTYSPFKILEFRELVERLPWRGDERVLDIGCGSGLQTFLIARRAGHTTGLDIDADFIAQAEGYRRFVRGVGRVDFTARSLLEQDWPDATFDRIFSICVLEHIPEHEAILRACRRLLRPGGEIVFSVDTLAGIDDPELRRRHQQAHHVVRYYRPAELQGLLEGLGFVDVTLQPLFRSELARELFALGIREGFNFGRLRAGRLAGQLARAEAAAPADAAEIFLAVRARA